MSGTLKATTLQDGASAVANLTFDANGNTTAGGTVAMASSFLRNRIINGDMRIDQRNAGAAQNNVAAATTYCVDRFAYYGTTGSKFSVGQNVGSAALPAGFTNYLGVSSLAATTPAATDVYVLGQKIEGFNIADFAWGTANAQTVTLSFWVQSSATGTFGGSLSNSNNTRNYAFSYTINSANTWEQKAITILGDTSGTWLTTSGVGLSIWFNFASGSSNFKAAGSWGSTQSYGPTGAVNVLANNGATFYITGVQLEVGTVATPFERRLYGQELILCQRYYYKTYNVDVVPGTVTNIGSIGSVSTSGGVSYTTAVHKTTMRITPNITLYNGSTGGTGTWRDGGAVDVSVTANIQGANGFVAYTSAASASTTINGQYTASAEL